MLFLLNILEVFNQPASFKSIKAAHLTLWMKHIENSFTWNSNINSNILCFLSLTMLTRSEKVALISKIFHLWFLRNPSSRINFKNFESKVTFIPLIMDPLFEDVLLGPSSPILSPFSMTWHSWSHVRPGCAPMFRITYDLSCP